MVQVLCHCDGKGISIVVKDQGQGFDPNTVPDPLNPENRGADHGRGIWLMRTEPATQCLVLPALVRERISVVERVNSSNKRG
jgi:anti-sigma regulatory factor (Ser/Thr protein kinase)